jgi:endonuclease III
MADCRDGYNGRGTPARLAPLQIRGLARPPESAMATKSRRDIAREVLQRHPKSHAEELHIDVGTNTPAPLFQWLIVSLLFSARISADTAQKAAKALFDQGWTTPEKMADTSWEERVRVLNRAGYARYDESTSRYIGATTDLLLERYGGDLRRLREDARHDPEEERKRLKAFKGIGEIGCDIFFREAQRAWDELYPFADTKALDGARSLGLGSDAKELADLVGRDDLPRLLAALVRVQLQDGVAAIKEA